MNATLLVLQVILFCCFIRIESSFILPDGFVKCNKSDLDFHKCAVKEFEQLVLMIINGIPVLDIRPLDPVHVDQAIFNTSPNSPIRLKLILRNITFYGFANTTIISVDEANFRKFFLRLTGRIPHAKVIANYNMDGKILYLPLKVEGTTVIHMHNMRIKLRSEHALEKRKNKSYAVLKNMTVDTIVEGGSVFYKSAKSSNILGLSDTELNKALNEYFLVMYNEYKPVVNNLIASLFQVEVAKFTNQVPLDELFT